MDDHGQRAIYEMNVSYPIHSLIFGNYAYDATFPYGPVICLDVSLHCAESAGTVVFNFGFK